MDSRVRTASSAGGQDRVRDRVADWLFLEGDRRVIMIGIIVAFVGIFGGFVSAGVVAVGPGSSVAGVFGSGLTAGVVTLVTIALSINQLILSRVFGSPGGLADRLDGSRALRERVQRLSGQPSSPNDPAAFLSLVAQTIDDRATTASTAVQRADPDSLAEVADVLTEIAAYGRSINTKIESEAPVTDVLGTIVGPEYAINMVAVRHLRNKYDDSLSPDAQADIKALDELLESVAVVRQFVKTLALQQDFAILSRRLIYSGLIAVLVSVSLTLVYRTGAVTIVQPRLVVLVPLALGVVVAPLALFAAYILRAATIAYRTVSVGPFIPPSNDE